MKKLFFYLFAVLAVAGMGSLTSCGTDDPLNPKTLTLEIVSATGYVSKDTTLTPGATFKVKWAATKGSSDLTTFTVAEGNTNVTNFPKTLAGAQKDAYSDEVTLTASANEGDVTYTFTVTDKDAKTASKTIKVTTASDINTSAVVLLGGQGNTTVGSVYSTSEDKVYKVGDVTTALQAKIDLVYGNGSATVNNHFIAAPDDPAVIDSGFGLFKSSIGTWGTKNPTILRTTGLSATDFDAIKTSAAITEKYNAGTASQPEGSTRPSRVLAANIETGKVVAFETASGKKGLFKVTNRSSAVTGNTTIELLVKVQK